MNFLKFTDIIERKTSDNSLCIDYHSQTNTTNFILFILLQDNRGKKDYQQNNLYAGDGLTEKKASKFEPRYFIHFSRPNQEKSLHLWFSFYKTLRKKEKDIDCD